MYCSGHGELVQGGCLCDTYYQGDDCNITWKEDGTWYTIWILYIVITMTTQACCLGFSVYQIVMTIRSEWIKWSVVTHILLLSFFAALIREIDFGIDPHGFRNIINPVLESIMFNLTEVMWLAGAYCLFFYWIELQQMSGIVELISVTRLKPVLIGCIIACVVVIFPIDIIRAIYRDTTAIAFVYSAFFALNLLIDAILSTVYGIKLMKVTKRIYKSTKISRFKAFLRRITLFIFGVNFMFVVGLVLNVAYIAFDAVHHKYLFVFLHMSLRIIEFFLVMFTLMLVNKKKPPRGDNSTGSIPSGTVEMVHIDLSVNDSEVREFVMTSM